MGGESKHPFGPGFVGIPIRDPDKMSEMERDKLYELFKKRFIGMTETQVSATLHFDERASDFINEHERESLFKARTAFKLALVTIGVVEKIDDFIAYYAARERQKGVVPRGVCWQIMHCRTRSELKKFYFQNFCLEPLMKRFKLTKKEYRRIVDTCLKEGVDVNTGRFQYALEAAGKGKNKRAFSTLMQIAIKAGHYESVKKVADARKLPITKRELKQLAKVILKTKIGTGHTHWYTEFFIEHPELGLGPAVVDTLLNYFWLRGPGERDINRDWWMLLDILRFSEKFNRPLTYREKCLVRDRLWLEHHPDNKKKALEIAKELVGMNPADAERLRAMKEDMFYEHLRNGEFDQAATLANQLGIEMTSRELYGQKHGQMRPDDKRRLHEELTKKLVEEVGKPSESIPSGRRSEETRTYH
jgi:hypothetical protein